MELHVKNMVCDRCVTSVRNILRELDFEVDAVELGQARVAEAEAGEERLNELQERLQDRGFELIRGDKPVLIERIRNKVLAYLKLLEETEDPPALSEYLAEQLPYNYSYLSHMFSETTGSTIERHLIRLKIERVKELLTYGEHTLAEIAWKLNYSSSQYLSNQFKSVTGITVSAFRSDDEPGRRAALDSLR